jgi:hypothetical protein
LLELILLNSVCFLGGLSYRSLLSLKIAIVNNLKTSHVLLLLGPQALLFFSLLLEKLLLDQLLVTLVHNSSLLLIVKALEVIGLDSVRSQH